MATLDPPEPHASSAAIAPPPEDAPAAMAEVAPAPEPWTPERALEWNRYYDRYLVGGVVLLVFLVSAHKITNSNLWPLIKAGQVTIQQGRPLTTDPFSYTREGKTWVNVPWLYEVASYLVFRVGSTLVPKAEQNGSVALQIGAGLLVGMNAAARALSVLLLFRLRKPGPGLWWFTLVGLVAMGAVVAPRLASLEVAPGGIARQPPIMPETWGVLLLAVEILLLHKGMGDGKPRALFGLLPLFVLWANLDESFAFGLLVLIAAAAGAMGRKAPGESCPSPALVWGIAAGCLVACMANPSVYRVYGTAFGPYLEIPRVIASPYRGDVPADQYSFFGRESFGAIASLDALSGLPNDSAPWWRLGYYLVVVLVGLGSFLINLRALDPVRLLVFVAAAVLWGGLSRLSAEFATVFVYAVGLNGQEWYQRRYGVEGRTSGSWSAWSVGGRAVTILLLFLAIAKTLTGYGQDMTSYPRVQPVFGFGVIPSEFDFEAADFLKKAPIAGRVLNLNSSQGDALIWRAYPERKTFIDRRRGVFDAEVREDLAKIRQAFPLDESDKTVVRFKSVPEQWRPVLDKYQTSALMLDPAELPFLYAGLRRDTEHFVPIYDDGRTVVFGRMDAVAEDRKFFEENKLDAASQVYRRPQSVPFPDRAPTPMTFLDRIVRNRALIPPQPHVFSSYRWLEAGMMATSAGKPDPAFWIMAIREARVALSYNPDEPKAYLRLVEAYERLVDAEGRIFRAKSAPIPQEYLAFRHRQRVTALNYAIQTTPYPRTELERIGLAQLHFELARLYRENRVLDMEMDSLAAAREMLAPAGLDPQDQRRLEQIEDALGRFKEQLPQLADPQQGARLATQNGFLKLAIDELEQAEGQGVSADAVLSSLVDLYCRTGQPDKANEKISERVIDDPALSNGPGTAPYRHGLVSFLLGYYDNTIKIWRDKAIRDLRSTESRAATNIGRQIIQGQARAGVSGIMDLLGLPGSPGQVDLQASWEWELGLCMLEAGKPREAAEQFLAVLQINPKTPMRPLLEDYLRKMDVPIPPVEAAPTATTPPAEEKPATPPAEEKPAK